MSMQSSSLSRSAIGKLSAAEQACHNIKAIFELVLQIVPYITVNDMQLYYEELGAGSPVVLLHGAMGSIDLAHSGWTELMPIFAEKFRVIHLEYRGHGRTNNPSGLLTYELIANDVAAFTKVLGLGRCHIAGVSDGAIVALHLGMHKDLLVGSLTCVGANYYNDNLCRTANEMLASNIDNPAWTEEMAAVHDRNKYRGYWRELFDLTIQNLVDNPNYSEQDLCKIGAPTLLMAGENDRWANAEQMAIMSRAIPKSESLIIGDAGHVIQYTHPHIVGARVMDFWQRHSKTLDSAIP